MNRHVSDIMLAVVDLKNTKPLVGGNHELYGTNMHHLMRGSQCDRLVFDNSDKQQNENAFVNGVLDEKTGQTRDKLDNIKKDFITKLNKKKKSLQLFTKLRIGGKKFIFKHTNVTTKQQLEHMRECKKHEIENMKEFLPERNIDIDIKKANLCTKEQWFGEEAPLEFELTGDAAINGFDKKWNKGKGHKRYSLVEDYHHVEDMKLEGQDIFICFGHNHSAINNKNYTKKNCLCVDCDLYEHQTEKEAAQKCNCFRISSDGTQIDVINLYTGRTLETFYTFQNKRAQEEQIKKGQEINQWFEHGYKSLEISNYINNNAEIKPETINEDSIIAYLRDKDVFKNRGNAFTRQIGFDRRRKARFNALCEVLEEKIRAKMDNTFTFGDNLDNIADEKIDKIKELFRVNRNNNPSPEAVIYNERNNLSNTQTIRRIKEDIARRLNQVGCCC